MTSAPPDQTVWWDAAATATAVLEALRLADGDVDADRIDTLIPVAGAIVNDYLDRAEALPTPPPAPVQWALEQTVTALYRSKDAGSGNPDDFSVEALVTRYRSVDPVADVLATLRPYKQRFGIG